MGGLDGVGEGCRAASVVFFTDWVRVQVSGLGVRGFGRSLFRKKRF